MTWAFRSGPDAGSDELLRGEELGRLHAAVAFVLDDRSGLRAAGAWRS